MNSIAAKRRRTMFEWLWDFFASVKVAIVIIVLIALSAIIGTILPQESFIPSANPASYYPQTYGKFGEIYFKMGFTNMYTSSWFVSLLLALGVSLVICSLERVIPLYKSLQRQEVKPALSVVQRKKIYVAVNESDEKSVDRLVYELAKRRYRIRREGSAFFAEKMRISRFGAYIIHIGLIILILGALSRLIPGWYVSENILVEEGQTVNVPGSDFAVRNDDFIVEYYQDGRPKHFETKAVIIDNGQEVLRRGIIVNEPLKYKGTLLFQASFLPPMLRTLEVELSEKASSKKLGTFEINFSNVQNEYKAGEYKVRVLDYFPDFDMKNDQPITRSTDPNNPVLLIQIEGPGVEKPTPQLFFVYRQLNLDQNTSFDLTPVNGKLIETTGLRVQKDKGIPIVYAGCLVVLAGLVLVFYFQHRRVWGQIHDGVLHLGAQTSKNWYGMRKEMEGVFRSLDWPQEIQLRQGGKG
ncbi:cytochrome c biogenesis protein ResB [Effusibacillus consociatus]|uniref:Cytochrome c biogenesis protein ResB n=1 Tax=Effusibacillus consociatus TaxID=1117041 RepID=A0ABV9PY82_9BACL